MVGHRSTRIIFFGSVQASDVTWFTISERVPHEASLDMLPSSSKTHDIYFCPRICPFFLSIHLCLCKSVSCSLPAVIVRQVITKECSVVHTSWWPSDHDTYVCITGVTTPCSFLSMVVYRFFGEPHMTESPFFPSGTFCGTRTILPNKHRNNNPRSGFRESRERACHYP